MKRDSRMELVRNKGVVSLARKEGWAMGGAQAESLGNSNRESAYLGSKRSTLE
ncbi:hypothetical protein ACFLXE_05035 [Chloroflexota bacterium]